MRNATRDQNCRFMVSLGRDVMKRQGEGEQEGRERRTGKGKTGETGRSGT